MLHAFFEPHISDQLRDGLYKCEDVDAHIDAATGRYKLPETAFVHFLKVSETYKNGDARTKLLMIFF